MKENKAEAMNTADEKEETVVLPDEKMKKVFGGFGENIPRVPENDIEKDIKDRF